MLFLNIYQYQVWSNLLDTMKWYHNHRIISQFPPYSTTGWYHNLSDTPLTLIKFQITHMTKALTFPHTDHFFFAKLTITNHIITSMLPFLYYMILFRQIYKKDTVFHSGIFFLIFYTPFFFFKQYKITPFATTAPRNITIPSICETGICVPGISSWSVLIPSTKKRTIPYPPR